MTAFDATQYVAGWTARARADEVSRAARASRARSLLPSVVSLLVVRFGARRVVLFGSLAEGRFRDDSDIDVAVEGLGPEFFVAWAACQDVVEDEFLIDLVPVEDLRPGLLDAVGRGELLHG